MNHSMLKKNSNITITQASTDRTHLGHPTSKSSTHRILQTHMNLKVANQFYHHRISSRLKFLYWRHLMIKVAAYKFFHPKRLRLEEIQVRRNKLNRKQMLLIPQDFRHNNLMVIVIVSQTKIHLTKQGKYCCNLIEMKSNLWILTFRNQLLSPKTNATQTP